MDLEMTGLDPTTDAIVEVATLVTDDELDVVAEPLVAHDHPDRRSLEARVEELLAQVWGHTHTTNRTVDVHVSRLRTKLADPEVVTTVYGLGYRLADGASVTVAE